MGEGEQNSEAPQVQILKNGGHLLVPYFMEHFYLITIRKYGIPMTCTGIPKEGRAMVSVDS
jgi:hypothetical protein